MSQRVLALAVRDHLRSVLGLSDEECDVIPAPGRPPAGCGQTFVGVWEGGVSNSTTEARSDAHSMNVTISRRSDSVPYDREAIENMHHEVIGLEVFADDVAAAIHDNNTVRQLANERLDRFSGNRTVYGFAEPLRYASTSATQTRGGDWFGSDQRGGGTGRSITVAFHRGMRVQSNTRQT